LGRARRLATAASTAERTPKVRRALGHARTALQQATRLVEKRRGLLEPACVTALQQALADMLSRTEGLRAPLLH
jgi:alkylation response protein AidB-like acyl-CoA dehydrogenase